MTWKVKFSGQTKTVIVRFPRELWIKMASYAAGVVPAEHQFNYSQFIRDSVEEKLQRLFLAKPSEIGKYGIAGVRDWKRRIVEEPDSDEASDAQTAVLRETIIKPHVGPIRGSVYDAADEDEE